MGVLVEKDNFGEIIRLERNSAVLMTYYRNNIQHLFVLPSLVASIVLHYEAIQKDVYKRQEKDSIRAKKVRSK